MIEEAFREGKRRLERIIPEFFDDVEVKYLQLKAMGSDGTCYGTTAKLKKDGHDIGNIWYYEDEPKWGAQTGCLDKKYEDNFKEVKKKLNS